MMVAMMMLRPHTGKFTTGDYDATTTETTGSYDGDSVFAGTCTMASWDGTCGVLQPGV